MIEKKVIIWQIYTVFWAKPSIWTMEEKAPIQRRKNVFFFRRIKEEQTYLLISRPGQNRRHSLTNYVILFLSIIWNALITKRFEIETSYLDSMLSAIWTKPIANNVWIPSLHQGWFPTNRANHSSFHCPWFALFWNSSGIVYHFNVILITGVTVTT